MVPLLLTNRHRLLFARWLVLWAGVRSSKKRSFRDHFVTVVINELEQIWLVLKAPPQGEFDEKEGDGVD